MLKSIRIILINLLVLLPIELLHSQEPPEPCPTCVQPMAQGSKWNLILISQPKFTVFADSYDIDGFENTAETVASIHAKGSLAICYLNAGAFENWRPDAKAFPKSIKGKTTGWRGERWLDIRQKSILLPILEARIKMCKDKGFDAVDFDNVDGYTNKTNFPLTKQDQLDFNILLANLAHRYGLLVGLKNDLGQIKALEPYFDFAINEQCFQYNECNRLLPFIQAKKAVLNVEYMLKPSQFCAKAKGLNFSSIKKKLELTESVIFCN